MFIEYFNHPKNSKCAVFKLDSNVLRRMSSLIKQTEKIAFCKAWMNKLEGRRQSRRSSRLTTLSLNDIIPSERW